MEEIGRRIWSWMARQMRRIGKAMRRRQPSVVYSRPEVDEWMFEQHFDRLHCAEPSQARHLVTLFTSLELSSPCSLECRQSVAAYADSARTAAT